MARFEQDDKSLFLGGFQVNPFKREFQIMEEVFFFIVRNLEEIFVALSSKNLNVLSRPHSQVIPATSDLINNMSVFDGLLKWLIICVECFEGPHFGMGLLAVLSERG